jgi:hypothetical protein
MGLQAYDVVTEGRHPHKTTLMLSDEDAKRMGVYDQKSDTAEKKAAPKKTAAPKTTTPRKARTPRNKAAKPADDKAAAAPATPPAGGVEDASDPDASEA